MICYYIKLIVYYMTYDHLWPFMTLSFRIIQCSPYPGAPKERKAVQPHHVATKDSERLHLTWWFLKAWNDRTSPWSQNHLAHWHHHLCPPKHGCDWGHLVDKWDEGVGFTCPQLFENVATSFRIQKTDPIYCRCIKHWVCFAMLCVA